MQNNTIMCYTMISVDGCKAILEQYDYYIKDDEIECLRDFLTMMAFSQLTNNKDIKAD